ncbi:MAG TPA: NADP-dependent oxidoreductase, partial [Candidatus Xenobia bacterium]
LHLLLPFRLPIVMGNDCSGVVEAVGAEVTRFKPGDEVYARVGKDRLGTFAEQTILLEAETALKPRRLSHVEAASLPLVGLTAWQALIDIAHTQAGQKVLIHAGAGGVGTFAIQLASRHLRARTLTTASAVDHARLKALGADVLIDYKTQDFTAQVKDVDVVFDTQGGVTLEKSFRVARRGGHIVSIGAIPYRKSLQDFRLPFGAGLLLDMINWRLFRLARLREVHYTYLFMRPSGEQLAEMARLVDDGAIQAVVDQVFPLGRAEEALQYVKAGRAKGKVVLDLTL